MKSFPEKIKEARSALSMSQETLAEKVGASRRSIIAYEKGDKHPRDRMLYQLAKALHVSIRYLKDDTCENPREDIEKDIYILEAQNEYGARDARNVAALLAESQALFAGGELSQTEKGLFFEALMTAYVTSKQQAKEKYGKKKS